MMSRASLVSHFIKTILDAVPERITQLLLHPVYEIKILP
jgi:hypothetical protein